jgi:hypothetical protein
MVAMGTADRECTSSHDYTKVSGPKKVAMKPNLSSSKKEEQVVIPTRKILWNKNG